MLAMVIDGNYYSQFRFYLLSVLASGDIQCCLTTNKHRQPVDAHKISVELFLTFIAAQFRLLPM